MILLSAGTAAIAQTGSDPQSASHAAVAEARLAAAEVRKLSGRHIDLYTDVPSRSAIDSLPGTFDKAVPLWAAYFGVDAAATADWRVQVFLIRDRDKFAALGLLPREQQLLHGYSIGSDIWLVDQPSDYYRRHLLLHEGTHAFMNHFLGGCGPGWYMEGTAELLGTHRINPRTGALRLGTMPLDRRDVPMWGRTRLVRDAVAKGQTLELPAVMRLDNRRQMEDEAYAWCWAAAKFFDAHPRYQDRFRSLKRFVRDPDFNERFQREFAADWKELSAEWEAYVATLDYGYDFKRMAFDFRPGTPLDGHARTVTIAADRGWQSSGVWLDANQTYRVSAFGRYQIAVEDGVTWPCEPGGVTIEYHDGRPLGMLLGAIVNSSPAASSSIASFARPIPIGLGRTISPDVSGTLYLRVNDSPARLADNRGTLTIEIAD